MKLNLGSGKVVFPVVKDAEPEVVKHLLPLPASAYEPGWVNVDKRSNPGVHETLDLFRFPWLRSSNGSPFNTSSVDEIYASHLIEHIPHQARANPMPSRALETDYGKLVDDLDGWFVFFYECWRILKPNGLMHIVTPFALSVPALCDPTHTRYIVAGTFSYLSRANDAGAPFDYNLPMWFEAVSEPTYRIRPAWWERLRDLPPEEMAQAAYRYFDVADEIRITLRAVKKE